jgi:hypothetical protein
MGRLVVPGHIGVISLHRRDDVNQAGVIAASLRDALNNCFVADMALGDGPMVTPVSTASCAAPSRTRSRSVCAKTGQSKMRMALAHRNLVIPSS